MLATSLAFTIAGGRASRKGAAEALSRVDEFVWTWAALNDALNDVRRAESVALRPARNGRASCAAPHYIARRNRADRLAARVAALLETRAITISGVTATACCIAVQTGVGKVTLDCGADPELGLSLAHDLIEMGKRGD